MTEQLSPQKRYINIDTIRILAIICVLYNHFPCYYYFINSDIHKIGILQYILLLPSMLCKCGVPLFFMISGAMLIGRHETFQEIFKKRIIRILIIMVILTFCVSIRDHSYNFVKIFFCDLNWYMYAYLAFLILLPFMDILATHMKKNHWNYFLCAVFFCSSIFGILAYAGINSQMLIHYLPLFGNSWASNAWHIIYPLAGYYFYKIYTPQKKDNFIICVTAITSIILSLLLVVADKFTNGASNFEMLHQHFIYMPSIFVFILIRHFHTTKPLIEKLITKIGQLTFGIYLIDTHTNLRNIFLDNISAHFVKYIGKIGSSFITLFLEFIACACIVWGLKKLPYLKKLL